MISDKNSLSSVKLDALFTNISVALKHTGSIWKYDRDSGYSDSANKFDKFFIEKLNDYASTLNAEQSVSAHMSVNEIVKPHVSQKYILQIDLKKYYESINFEFVKEHFVKAKFDINFIKHIRLFYFDKDGFLKRGLRGSSLISELTGIRIDNIVGRLLHEQSLDTITYSRFYDDMLFSSNERTDLRQAETKMTELLEPIGLTINTDKTKLKIVENSLILGLRVYKSKIIVPKKFKHLVRAREHRLKKYYAQIDWSDVTDVRELKRFTGHVIGSLWYIVKNSQEDTIIYSERIEEYKDILRDCDNAINEIYEEIEDVLYDSRD